MSRSFKDGFPAITGMKINGHEDIDNEGTYETCATEEENIKEASEIRSFCIPFSSKS